MTPSEPLRRIYKDVSTQPQGDGFGVTLDGRMLKTPAKNTVLLPSQALAEAVAAEWEAQEKHILPATMPLMQLTATALDRMTRDRADVSDALVKYAETDLLCYREANTADLVARQSRGWDPLLDWARSDLGVDLKVTTGLMPEPQDATVFGRLRTLVDAMDIWTLAVLSIAVQGSGSIILGLAFVTARLGADDLFNLSQIDETWQIELWGEDLEAAERRANLKKDFRAAAEFMRLVQTR